MPYMPTTKPKLLFVIEQELIDRIDNYRFENRINSRAAAIRRLIEESLQKYESKKQNRTK